jgi:hypothetical protein
MARDFHAVFAALKPVFAGVSARLSVAADSGVEYSLETRAPSPFPQHKGRPLHFGAVRMGKAYVSVHLMPIYMSPPLIKRISPALRRRMQGKSCFNFTTVPSAGEMADLRALVDGGLAEWAEKGWL